MFELITLIYTFYLTSCCLDLYLIELISVYEVTRSTLVCSERLVECASTSL